MTNQEMETEVRKVADELRVAFHKYWELNGQPHPSSNAYIALTRAFYYAAGIEKGIELMTGINEND